MFHLHLVYHELGINRSHLNQQVLHSKITLNVSNKTNVHSIQLHISSQFFFGLLKIDLKHRSKYCSTYLQFSHLFSVAVAKQQVTSSFIDACKRNCSHVPFRDASSRI